MSAKSKVEGYEIAPLEAISSAADEAGRSACYPSQTVDIVSATLPSYPALSDVPSNLGDFWSQSISGLLPG